MLRGPSEIRIDNHGLHADLREGDSEARGDHGRAFALIGARDLQAAPIVTQDDLEAGSQRAILLLQWLCALEIPGRDTARASERAFARQTTDHGRGRELGDVGWGRD